MDRHTSPSRPAHHDLPITTCPSCKARCPGWRRTAACPCRSCCTRVGGVMHTPLEAAEQREQRRERRTCSRLAVDSTNVFSDSRDGATSRPAARAVAAARREHVHWRSLRCVQYDNHDGINPRDTTPQMPLRLWAHAIHTIRPCAIRHSNRSQRSGSIWVLET